MSDREELRRIEALPDDDSAVAPEPEEAPPQVQAAATEDEAEVEDDGPLSPADLVAESVRQDAEAEGESVEAAAATETPTDPAEATPFDDLSPDEKIAVLQKRADRADELEAWVTEQEATREEKAVTDEWERVQAEARGFAASAKAHFRSERKRLLGQLWIDAQRQSDPDTYYTQNIDRIDAAVDALYDQQIADKATEVQNAKEQLEGRWYQTQWQRNQDGFADHLIASLKLAPTSYIKAELLKANRTPEDMEERAEFLQRVQTQFLSSHDKQSQAEREAVNANLKLVSTHPAQGGKPVRKKPVQYKGTAAELREIERMDRLSG